MGSFLPVPEKVAAANPNWSVNPATFVGNGPFTLKSWGHTDSIRVQKNPAYWDEKSVSLKEIELIMVSNDTEIRMFEEHKLDWAGSPLSTLPVDAIPSLREAKILKTNPLSGTYFIRVNTAEQIGEKPNPLHNANFRKALGYSIDREGIATHILQGGKIPATSLVPPEMGLFGEGYLSKTAKPKEFLDQALEEMSLSTVEPLTLTFIVADQNMAIAQGLQKQIEKALGVPISLEASESKVFYQRVKKKDFQLALGSWIADFNDPVNFLEVFKYKTGSTNNTNWENAKYIDLLERSALCGNQDERKQILREAEEILMDQMPIIPIFHFVMAYMQQDGVEGVALSPIGQVDFRWAQFDEAKHSR
jgi:oligopeptide transport system substrate-binding protein